MMHSQSRRGDRHSGVFLDVFHLIVGILVVVLGLLSFLNPEGHEVLFPLVFFLAAALNAVSGVFELKTQGHDKKKRRTGYQKCNGHRQYLTQVLVEEIVA